MNNALVWILIIGAIVGLVVALSIPNPEPVLPMNLQPAWSPDGSRISYSSNRDGNWEVYLLDVNTSDATRVTDNDVLDWYSTWSPAGDLLVFVSNRDARSKDGYDIYTIDPVGRDVTRLTYRARGWDSDPCWSSDPTASEVPADSIVFASERDGNYEIYRLVLPDRSVTRLTYREQNADGEPSVSPDGSRIVFQSMVEGNWEIFVMDADGSRVKRLTFNAADDRLPAWSPDGQRIAFTSDRDGNSEIYVMDVDGANKRNLTTNPASDRDPTWSPDSRMIAFQSNRSGTVEIWRMTAVDGTGQKQLTGLK